MRYFFGFIIFVLLIISTILNNMSKKRYVNLLDEKYKEKLNDFEYKAFEIHRKRRLQKSIFSKLYSFQECSLEYPEYSPSGMVYGGIEDVIEIYGIENDNKHLIFKIHFSRDLAKKLKNIVMELNEKN